MRGLRGLCEMRALLPLGLKVFGGAVQWGFPRSCGHEILQIQGAKSTNLKIIKILQRYYKDKTLHTGRACGLRTLAKENQRFDLAQKFLRRDSPSLMGASSNFLRNLLSLLKCFSCSSRSGGKSLSRGYPSGTDLILQEETGSSSSSGSNW